MPEIGGEPFTFCNPSHPNALITLRMLLTHTSSFDDYYEYWRQCRYVVPACHTRILRFLSQFCFGMLLCSPAESFARFLGMAIEVGASPLTGFSDVHVRTLGFRGRGEEVTNTLWFSTLLGENS